MGPNSLTDFLGTWRFSRLIRDARGAEIGQVAGQVAITGDASQARFDEAGEMVLPGQQPLKAARSYLWVADPAGVAVSFDDGRPFHLIRLDAPQSEAEHWCDPDSYHVAYDFTLWPLWTATWRVTGPRKDYLMVTAYERA